EGRSAQLAIRSWSVTASDGARVPRVCDLVSRFRRSYPFAARARTNVGTKGTLAIYDSSAVFGFEVPTRTRGYNDRNFKSTALGDTVKFFGNDQPSLPLCVRLGRSRP